MTNINSSKFVNSGIETTANNSANNQKTEIIEGIKKDANNLISEIDANVLSGVVTRDDADFLISKIQSDIIQKSSLINGYDSSLLSNSSYNNISYELTSIQSSYNQIIDQIGKIQSGLGAIGNAASEIGGVDFTDESEIGDFISGISDLISSANSLEKELMTLSNQIDLLSNNSEITKQAKAISDNIKMINGLIFSAIAFYENTIVQYAQSALSMESFETKTDLSGFVVVYRYFTIDDVSSSTLSSLIQKMNEYKTKNDALVNSINASISSVNSNKFAGVSISAFDFLEDGSVISDTYQTDIQSVIDIKTTEETEIITETEQRLLSVENILVPFKADMESRPVVGWIINTDANDSEIYTELIAELTSMVDWIEYADTFYSEINGFIQTFQSHLSACQFNQYTVEHRSQLIEITGRITSLHNAFLLSNISEITSIFQKVSLIESFKTLCVSIMTGLTQLRFSSVYSFDAIKSKINSINDSIVLLSDVGKFSGISEENFNNSKATIKSLIDQIISIRSVLSNLQKTASSISGGLTKAREIKEQAEEIASRTSPKKRKQYEEKKYGNTYWKNATIGQMFKTSDIQRLQSGVSRIKSAMDKVKSVLDGVRSIADLLKQIESVITDPLLTFINSFLGAFKGFIQNLKSTGVYYLDMFEYAYIGNEIHIDADSITEVLFDIDSSVYKEFLQEQITFDENSISSGANNSLSSNEIKNIFIQDYYGASDQQIGTLDKNYERTTQVENELVELQKTYEEQRLEINNNPSMTEAQKEQNLKLAEARYEETKLTKSTTLNSLKTERRQVIKEITGSKKDESDEEKRNREKQGLTDSETWKKFKRAMTKISMFYRPMSYSEWIQTVADAFVDKYDMPDGEIVNAMRSVNNRQTKMSTEDWRAYSEFTQKQFKPGAPRFGEGSMASVMIICVASPNLKEFLSLWERLKSIFNMTSNGKAVNEISNFFTTIDNMPENGFPERETFLEYLHTQAVEQWEDFNKIYSVIDAGQKPDFYGTNMAMMFHDIFNTINQIYHFLENYLGDVPSPFADEISSLLDTIDRRLKDVDRLLKYVDNLLDLMVSILNTGVYILKFDSNKGVNDIYDRLINASDFPFNPDQKIFIGGYVLCYGIPDIAQAKNEISMDIEKYYETFTTEVDEEAQEVKSAFNKDMQMLKKIMKSFRV